MLASAGIDVAPYRRHDGDELRSRCRRLDGHGMDELAEDATSTTRASRSRTCAAPARSRSRFDQVPLDRATDYAAEDADVTLRLWLRFKPRLSREKATRVYEMVDRPLVPVVGRMERPASRSTATIWRGCQPRIRRRDRARSRSEIHARPAARSRSAAPSSSARCCSRGSASRAGARASRALFDRRHRTRAARRARASECAQQVLDWRQLTKLEIDLHRRAAGADQSGDRPRPHQLSR